MAADLFTPAGLAAGMRDGNIYENHYITHASHGILAAHEYGIGSKEQGLELVPINAHHLRLLHTISNNRPEPKICKQFIRQNIGTPIVKIGFEENSNLLPIRASSIQSIIVEYWVPLLPRIISSISEQGWFAYTLRPIPGSRNGVRVPVEVTSSTHTFYVVRGAYAGVRVVAIQNRSKRRTRQVDKSVHIYVHNCPNDHGFLTTPVSGILRQITLLWQMQEAETVSNRNRAMPILPVAPRENKTTQNVMAMLAGEVDGSDRAHASAVMAGHQHVTQTAVDTMGGICATQNARVGEHNPDGKAVRMDPFTGLPLYADDDSHAAIRKRMFVLHPSLRFEHAPHAQPVAGVTDRNSTISDHYYALYGLNRRLMEPRGVARASNAIQDTANAAKMIAPWKELMVRLFKNIYQQTIGPLRFPLASVAQSSITSIVKRIMTTQQTIRHKAHQQTQQELASRPTRTKGGAGATAHAAQEQNKKEKKKSKAAPAVEEGVKADGINDLGRTPSAAPTAAVTPEEPKAPSLSAASATKAARANERLEHLHNYAEKKVRQIKTISTERFLDLQQKNPVIASLFADLRDQLQELKHKITAGSTMLEVIITFPSEKPPELLLELHRSNIITSQFLADELRRTMGFPHQAFVVNAVEEEGGEEEERKEGAQREKNGSERTAATRKTATTPQETKPTSSVPASQRATVLPQAESQHTRPTGKRHTVTPGGAAGSDSEEERRKHKKRRATLPSDARSVRTKRPRKQVPARG